MLIHYLFWVCVFCYVCTTQSDCASHVDINDLEAGAEEVIRQKRDTSFFLDTQTNAVHHQHPDDKGKPHTHKRSIEATGQIEAVHHQHPDDKGKPHKWKRSLEPSEQIQAILHPDDKGKPHKWRRSVQKEPNTDILDGIFNKFGSGRILDSDGLERMLEKLDIDQNCSSTIKSLQRKTMKQPLDGSEFTQACPTLIYNMLHQQPCLKTQALEPKHHLDAKTWMFSFVAVLIISVCGLAALLIVPLMNKKLYTPLIQFLVALAVGTLAGDALLHLLPHAMGGDNHEHGHSHNQEEDSHLKNTWMGLVAMMGLAFFFVMEKLILLAGKWRKEKQTTETAPHAHVKVCSDQMERRNSTQCTAKFNASPYCFKDVLMDPNAAYLDPDNATELLAPTAEFIQRRLSRVLMEKNHNLTDDNLRDAKVLTQDKEDFTLYVKDHPEDQVAPPQTYSSVAWMVIMGDGLHNFTDGMAIGAAFATGMAGGFSTTVAVFCHELPHELGDFAMLLKAGMSIKQAMFYNLLSSVLCILGNFLGLYLGNTESANQWVFAAAAGTFIYIALVDMIPELTSVHEGGESLSQYFLHLTGLMAGVGIMAVIALYEHDLKHLFNDPE